MVVQLRDALRDLIGEMKPGEQLPSESELVGRFGVARGTIREALKLLEQDGLVDVHHGRGRFVSAVAGLGVNRPITHFEGVTEMLRALGFSPRTKIVSVSVAEADEEEAAALGIARGEAVVRLARLRTSGTKPLVLSLNSFRASLLGDEDVAQQDFSGSLHQWLRDRGATPESSAAQIRAARLPDDLRDTMPSDAVDEPWLLTIERCFDDTGGIVLYSRDYHRGDMFSFHVVRRRTD